ncbi:MAG: hypothetical protein ACR2J7_07910 [Luteimonas sp.]
MRIGGCNDCHTAGYAEQQGKVDRAQWLLGSPLGYRGPWGTTYGANLRLTLSGMDEAQWLAYSGELHTRPPMPDFALRDMHKDDRRAIYRFVRSLGPGGAPAPAYLPPGQQPEAPYFELVLCPPRRPPWQPSKGAVGSAEGPTALAEAHYWPQIEHHRCIEPCRLVDGARASAPARYGGGRARMTPAT